MATYIEMPKLADTMTEGTLIKWRKKEGDKVTVKAHPLKDGGPGGQLLSVVLPNGQTLGDK